MSTYVLTVLVAAALALTPAAAAGQARHARRPVGDSKLLRYARQAGRRRRAGVDPARARRTAAMGAHPPAVVRRQQAAVAPGALLGRRRGLGALRHRHPPRAGRRDLHLPAPPSPARASCCAAPSTWSGIWGTKVVDRAHMTTTAGHRDSKDRQRRVSRSSWRSCGSEQAGVVGDDSRHPERVELGDAHRSSTVHT